MKRVAILGGGPAGAFAAEQLASVAGEMASQADALKTSMAIFRIDADHIADSRGKSAGSIRQQFRAAPSATTSM